MREVIVHPSPEIWTEITEVEIPQPGPDDVVIKVVVAGSNVKDWLHLKALKKSLSSGDDIAGFVHSIGTHVQTKNEYSLGERVAAFHPMMNPHGAYAEYAVAPIHTVVKLPDIITFEGSNKYDEESIQTGIEVVYTMVGTAHTGVYKPDMVKQPSDKEFVKGDPEWVAVFFKYMSQKLEDGRLTGHPFDVIDGGLAGVGEGLRRLQRGQARGVKYVYKIGEVE
ncbi:hypothetical protein ACHAQE_004251 [Botrytis cinerea]